MRYIYYIIGIMLLVTGLAAFGIFTGGSIKVSEPLFSVNDRVVSEAEFERMMARKPYHMSREEFMDSVIDRQLQIQEAIRMGINKEENFRSAIENYYEQSLIKVLIDRQYDSLSVNVSSEETEQFRDRLYDVVTLTRWVYPSLADLEQKTNETVQTMAFVFLELPDDLKYTIFTLEPGMVSQPVKFAGMDEYYVYRLDGIQAGEKPADSGTGEVYNEERIRELIADKKQERLLDEWMASIRESAAIWRKK